MLNHYRISLALASCVLAPLLLGAAPERGEIIGDHIYVNCQYRVAADFPTDPKFRDFTYRDGKRAASAREFYVDKGMDRLSVTVVHFTDGPDQEPQLVANAADALAKRGQVKFDMHVFYDEPGIPGRQMTVALANGRFLRGHVYMVNHRLYITASIADPNDYPAFLFEESVSLIDENGTDQDTNPVGVASNAPGTSAGLPPRQYDCSRINRQPRVTP